MERQPVWNPCKRQFRTGLRIRLIFPVLRIKTHQEPLIWIRSNLSIFFGSRPIKKPLIRIQSLSDFFRIQTHKNHWSGSGRFLALFPDPSPKKHWPGSWIWPFLVGKFIIIREGRKNLNKKRFCAAKSNTARKGFNIIWNLDHKI